MAVRIRYRKDKKGRYVSVRTFQSSSTGAKYKMRLNPDSMSYEIINTSNRNIVARGDGPKRLDKLKVKAKKRLKEFGVNFDIEVRDI